MSLVPALLQAIVRVDGEALVMHAGEKPYVVSPTGQVDLANRGLTLDAVSGIVNEMLPAEMQQALSEFGAIQYELPPMPEFPGEHFTVVAARGGDDLWAEIRRHRVVDNDFVAEGLLTPGAAAAAVAQQQVAAVAPAVQERTAAQPAAAISQPAAEMSTAALPAAAAQTPQSLWQAKPLPPLVPPPMADEITEAALNARLDQDDDLNLPGASQLWPARPPLHPGEEDEDGQEIEIDLDADVEEVLEPERMVAMPAVPEPVAAPVPTPMAEEPTTPAVPEPIAEPVPVAVPEPLPVAAELPQVEEPVAVPEPVAEEEPVAPAVEPIAEPFPTIAVEMPVVEQPIEVPAPAAEEAPSEPIAEPAPFAEPEPIAEPLPMAAEMPCAAEATEEPIAVEKRPSRSRRLSIAMAKRRAAAAMPPSSVDAVWRVVLPPSSVYTPKAPAASSTPSQPGVVLQISRSPIRADQPPPYVPDPTLSGLERLLRVSAARGAQTLYLSSGSRPSVRVDGELQVLDGEALNVARDVEALLLTLMPARHHEALRTGAATEWFTDVDGVGRVRCMSFRDHLGPGGVFRMMPTRSISAEHLSLPRQVQALATEPEGIVLVAGPRSGGKRTLMAAFVDMMNRARRDHIISIEREINIVHERGQSFISQREIRGSDEDLLNAARAALREDPDVLVIEDLRNAELMDVALEAAASGRLVVAGFSAHNATAAIDRIIDLYAPEERRQVQIALANSLRGVVVQTLLRKRGGGRLPAREVLLNTPAVSSAIAEGKTSQLPMAIEGGRRFGMMPLNDTLVGLVQNGSVEAKEAYRRSPDRPGFLAALNRQGLDTSFVERLA